MILYVNYFHQYMVVGLHGRSGVPVARPAAMVLRQERDLALILSHSMVDEIVRDILMR